MPVPEPPIAPSDGIRRRSKRSSPGNTPKFADCSRCPCEKQLDHHGSCNALLESNIVEIDMIEKVERVEDKETTDGAVVDKSEWPTLSMPGAHFARATSE